jgi:hypothetical protein
VTDTSGFMLTILRYFVVHEFTVPPMDAVDEGEAVYIVMEQGREFLTSKELIIDWYGKKGDMGAKVDQTLSATLSFTYKSGKYSVSKLY